MKHKPVGQRLHHFFLGVPSQLNKKEIAEIKAVINKEHENMLLFLAQYTPREN